jgi:hypothetical protein
MVGPLHAGLSPQDVIYVSVLAVSGRALTTRVQVRLHKIKVA